VKKKSMSDDCHNFLKKCLLFDIEVNERNVIYSIGAVHVGMSRARETLHLLKIDGVTNPHAEVFSGKFLQERRLLPSGNKERTSYRYALLGMEDLFIDYAGRRLENSAIRRALTVLNCGDVLSLAGRGDHLELVNNEGVSVARLSKKAKHIWDSRLEFIEEITIVAMIRRYRDDVDDEKFKNRCHGDMWEVPVVELSYRSLPTP